MIFLEYDSNIKDSNLITLDRQYDILILYNFFSKDDAKKIWFILLSLYLRENKLVWHYTSVECYFVKFGYWFAESLFEHIRNNSKNK